MEDVKTKVGIRADVPEYDILEQLRKIPVPFANCSRHPRSTLTSSLVC